MLMPDTQCMVYLYINIYFIYPPPKISPTVATFITHTWSICRQTATSPRRWFSQPSDLTGEQLETLPEGRCLREARNRDRCLPCGFGVALIGAAISKIQHECRCILMFKRVTSQKSGSGHWKLPQDTFLFFHPFPVFFLRKKRHTTSHRQKSVQTEHPKHRDTVRMFFLGMFLDV